MSYSNDSGGAGGDTGGRSYTFSQAVTRLSANDPDVELASSYLAGTLDPEHRRDVEARLQGADVKLRDIMDAFAAFWNQPAGAEDGVREITREEAAEFQRRLARRRGPVRWWFAFVDWWSSSA
jgi:hypothetical protein